MALFGALGNGKDKWEVAEGNEKSLGNILLRKGWISKETLEKAVMIQKSQVRLGRILVDDLEAITEEQLEDALEEQRILTGKASHKEEMTFRKKKRTQLLRDIDTGLKKITDTSTRIVAKLGKHGAAG